MITKQDSKSATTIFAVMDVLYRNSTDGFSNAELAKETGLTEASIARHAQTLVISGFAERVPATGHLRPHLRRHARYARQILNSLDNAKKALDETKARLYGGCEAEITRAYERLTRKQNHDA